MPDEATLPERLLTTDEAAAALGCHYRTLYLLMRRGVIARVKTDRKRILVSQSAINEFKQLQQTTGKSFAELLRDAEPVSA